MSSTSLLRPTALSAFLIACFAVACGGAYVPSEDGADDSGSNDNGAGGFVHTGGQAGTGGSVGPGGSPGTGAHAGTGGDGPACCLAEAVCDEGDTQIESGGDCPIGAVCYSHTACCSTVWCMEAQAPCDAIPTCQGGEVEVSACPEGSSCVQRALCGTVIVCELEGSVACDIGESVHVKWVGSSIEECQLIDFSCPEHTTGFSNHCGCGCQQPDTCPESIDCEPGGTVDPLCDSEECPYSPRAL